MLYKLENEYLEVTLSNKGGELNSIKGKLDGVEYLWNGDNTYWKYHAPILFPIVGKVIDGTYIVNGKNYNLPQHGLARLYNFNTIQESSNSISFELESSEKTLKIYPFRFSLIIKYTLDNQSIKVEYVVKNLDSNIMYFSIGAHPAFMCPILKDEELNDYYFEFEKKEVADTMELLNSGYFSHNEKRYLKNENIIELSKDLFKNDALVFNNLSSNKIWLKSKKHSKSIEFDFTNFPLLALWSKPTGAPFVCIEPWFGHADYIDFKGEFKDKAGIQSLEPLNTFKCTQVITIHQ